MVDGENFHPSELIVSEVVLASENEIELLGVGSTIPVEERDKDGLRLWPSILDLFF